MFFNIIISDRLTFNEDGNLIVKKYFTEPHINESLKPFNLSAQACLS